MKRGLVLGLTAMVLGCGDAGKMSVGANTGTGKPTKDKLRVLCSFFPVYLLTKNVVGDQSHVDVQLMMPASKGCPHAYDLTPADRKRIAAADIFVINGAGLEELELAKLKKDSPNTVVVDSSKGIKLIADEHDHHHGKGDKGHAHHHHHDGEGNPHFFSSPLQAAQQVRTIAAGLAKVDEPNAREYTANAENHAKKLEELGKEFKDRLANFPNKSIVTMHEVFAYLAQDAGFAIVGEIQTGHGSDAPARKLIDKIKKEKVRGVFTEPQYNEAHAQTIAKEAGVPVFMLDPVASGPDDAPIDYFEKKMRENLATLEKAFGIGAKP